MIALTPITASVAIACGMLVGFMLALTGGGGSTLAVPLLVYVLGMHDTHLAIGTSALAVAINAYINLIPHARKRHVHWKDALIFTTLGVLGTFAGSELGKSVQGDKLLALFATLMLVVAAFMAKPRRTTEIPRDTRTVANRRLRLTTTGFGAGALAGFFGVGGGFLIVPGLIIATGMSAVDAIGTSLFGVGSFGLATALNYARSDLVNWPIAAIFIAGGTMGGWFGAGIAHRLAAKQDLLKHLFAAVIAIVALVMLIRTVVSL